jgi:hypothetical protein
MARISPSPRSSEPPPPSRTHATSAARSRSRGSDPPGPWVNKPHTGQPRPFYEKNPTLSNMTYWKLGFFTEKPLNLVLAISFPSYLRFKRSWCPRDRLFKPVSFRILFWLYLVCFSSVSTVSSCVRFISTQTVC